MAPPCISLRHASTGVALCLVGLVAAGAMLRARASDELSVFAAVSLADALTEVGRAWQAHSGQQATFNFGASSDLARQIRAGAPADVFVSADVAQMDALEREGLVRASERHDLLSNALVVVVPKRGAARIPDPRELLRVRTIALADPQAVPAGIYARTWLERIGLWDTLAPRVVPTLHVRAALAAVESGNVEAAVVYRTDATGSRRARVAYEVPPAESPPIRYPVAPLAASTRPSAAAFVAYLRSPAARAVFVHHGFVVLEGR